MEMCAKSKILIPYDSIEDHIVCSICLSVIRGAVLTQCGHRYCTRCITEWIGRNHNCPCCNSGLQENQLYSDVQFDGLVDNILKERDRAEQTYFDSIFKLDSTDSIDSQEEHRKPSQFEKVLKDHMKSSLISHQKYFDKLREECQRKINLLDSGIGTEILSQNDVVQDKEIVKAALNTNLEESEKLAAEAYNRYLTDHLPSLDLLPVCVSVYIDGKGIRIPDVIINPIDKLSVIKPFVEAALLERGDQLVSWLDDVGFKLLFSPLCKTHHYDLEKIISNLGTIDGVHQLSWDSQPFFQCHMRPGSEIVLKDVLKCQSDFPKKCFAAVFRESGPQPVDYFSCEDCNFKWICKSCAQGCHTGHKLNVFVMNHTPTWACCYCPKKKMCKIQNI